MTDLFSDLGDDRKTSIGKTEVEYKTVSSSFYLYSVAVSRAVGILPCTSAIPERLPMSELQMTGCGIAVKRAATIS